MHPKITPAAAYQSLLTQLAPRYADASYTYWQPAGPHPLLLIGNENVDHSFTLVAVYTLGTSGPELISEVKLGFAGAQGRQVTAYQDGRLLEVVGSGQAWSAHLFEVAPDGQIVLAQTCPYDMQEPEKTLAKLGLSSSAMLDTRLLTWSAFELD